MIYQVKITLQHTSPPIWRRLLIRKDTVLTDVHEIIQIAFDWMDCHLHCFEPRKRNGESLYSRNIQIGTENEMLVGLMGYDFDEHEQTLSDWLIKEKDKLIYVYDFGDDWRHEIVLEKVLAPEQDVSYPYCVKALRTGAEEDSGGYVEEVEDVDAAELKESINIQLEDLAEAMPIAPTGRSIETSDGWNRLLQLTREFSELAPWRWLYDNQIFAIEHPVTEEFVYCSVLGAMGEEFGLATYHGQDGIQYLQSVLDGSIPTYDILTKNRGTVLSLCDRSEITPTDDEIVKREGFTFGETGQWPMFRSFTPGYYPWFLTDEEVDLFALILERAIEICKRAATGEILIEEFNDEGEMFAQIVREKQREIIWSDTYISKVNEVMHGEASELFVNELDLQRIKSIRKRYNSPLEIGVFYAPTPIQENEHVRPHLPVIFIVAERKAGSIIFHEMYESLNHREQSIQQSFMDLLHQLEAIPREIWMTTEDYLILKPIVQALKISVLQIKNLPIINRIKEDMHERFDG